MCIGFVLALASACATPNLGIRASRPTSSEGVTHTAGVYPGKGAQELFWQSWQPAAQDARDALVIVHGLKDHSSRYDDLGRLLARRGFAVHAFDLRGHGRSAGRRVWVEDFGDYVSDLELFVMQVRQAHPEARIFLFGHSMGGLIAATYAATRDPALAGLILSGPALELDIWPITVTASRLAGRLAGNLPALELANEDFSSNPDTLAAMDKDPLVYQEAGPARTAGELAAGIETLWSEVDQITMPLLLLHGSKDRLTDPHGSRDLHRLAPAEDKTLRIYEGYWHDLMHEPNARRVMEDVADWLDERTAREHH